MKAPCRHRPRRRCAGRTSHADRQQLQQRRRSRRRRAVETNTFISQNISADSIGDTWTFDFDYIKSTNVATSATTGAFIKVLDSVGGSFATLAFELLDTTGASDTTWAAGQLSITIDPAWDGQLLQFGFINTCSNFEDSGRIYDNIEWQGRRPRRPR